MVNKKIKVNREKIMPVLYLVVRKNLFCTMFSPPYLQLYPLFVDIFVTNSVFFVRDSHVFVFYFTEIVDKRDKTADIYNKFF